MQVGTIEKKNRNHRKKTSRSFFGSRRICLFFLGHVETHSVESAADELALQIIRKTSLLATFQSEKYRKEIAQRASAECVEKSP